MAWPAPSAVYIQARTLPDTRPTVTIPDVFPAFLPPDVSRDTARPTGAAAVDSLPSWDLSDLYKAPADPALKADLDAAEAAAKAFQAAHEGKVAGLSGDGLAAAIATYETIEEKLGRAMSYAQLVFSGDAQDAANGRFYQTIQERVTAISSHLLFLTLELNRVEDAALEQKLGASKALGRWRPWLRDLRVFRPHQLSDEVEKLLHEKEVTGRAAWNRLFDETIAGMRVTVAGEELTVSTALNKLSDRDREVRAAAAKGVSEAFGANVRLFSLITNVLAKDKEIIDGWRHYPRPTSYRNRSNMVEDEVVDALVSAVRESFPRLSHRYYAMKAKWLGLEKMMHWDRNAPLPDQDDRKIAWPEAVARVVSSYRAFSPELAELGQRFFDKPWVDAALRPGKASGAFAHPTVPSAHPYLLVNYHGKTRDVMTLAHELGHGVHQILAAQQGYLLSSTPLTLAETASVFGEMLTFRALLDAETDPRRRRALLASKVEDMLNTVVRQIAFYRFETLLHDERKRGEIAHERIGEIWMQVQQESLGPAFEFTPDYSVYWAYIPHFVHTPFYVYAYAFGDCLVNALYGVFREGHPRFQQKYLEMLKAGGTKRHKELLAPFGLDASDPAFWNKGLDVISGFIDELEQAA
jgi:oligoendopeptidase F